MSPRAEGYDLFECRGFLSYGFTYQGKKYAISIDCEEEHPSWSLAWATEGAFYTSPETFPSFLAARRAVRRMFS